MQNGASKISENKADRQSGLHGNILVVDDDRTLRSILELQLQNMDYNVLLAANGQEAFEVLHKESGNIDIILLDREMPVMDGMQFITRIKHDPGLKHIPVVMVTGSGQPQQVSEGIAAGVFYYLIKPIHYNVLASIVSSAMHESLRFKGLLTVFEKNNTGLQLMTKGHFTVKTLEQADQLTHLLAQCFDEPARVLSGISALMTNAIEHGNLAIGFEEKSRLIERNQWQDEIIYRQALPENALKQVDIRYEKTPQHHMLTIRDNGPGFVWEKYINFDAKLASLSNGRGIAQARNQSFDLVVYNEQGNEVTAIIHRKKQ